MREFEQLMFGAEHRRLANSRVHEIFVGRHPNDACAMPGNAEQCLDLRHVVEYGGEVSKVEV
jgi:hypothetical protein